MAVDLGRFRYILRVLGDEGDETTYEVHSPKRCDSRILQLAGMVLDGGAAPERIREELPTAQAYVSVEGDPTQDEQWVTDSLKAAVALKRVGHHYPEDDTDGDLPLELPPVPGNSDAVLPLQPVVAAHQPYSSRAYQDWVRFIVDTHRKQNWDKEQTPAQQMYEEELHERWADLSTAQQLRLWDLSADLQRAMAQEPEPALPTLWSVMGERVLGGVVWGLLVAGSLATVAGVLRLLGIIRG